MCLCVFFWPAAYLGSPELYLNSNLYFSGVYVSPGSGSAETLVRSGGEINHYLIAYSLSYGFAKNYQNRLMNIRIIACQVSVVFFLRHSVECPNLSRTFWSALPNAVLKK